jgi:hypothetical protein
VWVCAGDGDGDEEGNVDEMKIRRGSTRSTHSIIYTQSEDPYGFCNILYGRNTSMQSYSSSINSRK